MQFGRVGQKRLERSEWRRKAEGFGEKRHGEGRQSVWKGVCDVEVVSDVSMGGEAKSR